MITGGVNIAASTPKNLKLRVENNLSDEEAKIKVSFDRNKKITKVEGITSGGKKISFDKTSLIGQNANKLVNLLVKEVYKEGKSVDDVDRYKNFILIELEDDIDMDKGDFIKKLIVNTENITKNHGKKYNKNDDVKYLVGDYISIEKAEEIALRDSGYKKADVVFTEREFDYDDTRGLYEFEFHTGGIEYDYEIDGETGIIIKKNLDNKNYRKNIGKKPISLEEAEKLVLLDIKSSKDKLAHMKRKTDKDDGRKTYEFEFLLDGIEYKYKLDSLSGLIIKKEKNIKNIIKSKQKDYKYISVEKAEEIVLKDANLSLDKVVFKDRDFDYNNNRPVYEFEFIGDGLKYEYEIDAIDGSILKKEVDGKKTNSDKSPSKEGISMKEAEAIALKDAKASLDKVVFKDRDFDYDDNRPIYEFEFIFNGLEYQYEIDGLSGQIIEKEID